MEKYYLGKTGIKVTELCFGALPMGPMQANISVEKGAKLIRAGLERGINFIDTAEVYQTYPHIKKAFPFSKDKALLGQVLTQVPQPLQKVEINNLLLGLIF